jgi:hypothetical protein
MSMPQPFQVMVVAGEGEGAGALACAVASALTDAGEPVRPWIEAAAPEGALNVAELAGLLQQRCGAAIALRAVESVDARRVHLWLALDGTAEAAARKRVARAGPAPGGFYRLRYPDPVHRLRLDFLAPGEAGDPRAWLDELASRLAAWKQRLWTDFSDSS